MIHAYKHMPWNKNTHHQFKIVIQLHCITWFYSKISILAAGHHLFMLNVSHNSNVTPRNKCAYHSY